MFLSEVRRSARDREEIVTIDDVREKLRDTVTDLNADGAYQKLLDVLADVETLCDQKHPLALRRGTVLVNVERERKEVDSMKDGQKSRQIRAGSRTYFLDLAETKEKGVKYLKIVESRFKGEGKDRERATILIFPKTAREFANVVTEMVAELTQPA